MIKLNFTGVIKLLLVVSIVLQSLAAVASATSQFHQIDIDHIQTQHEHKNDISSNGEEISEDGHNISDCHHCGHCSGSHLSWVIIDNINISVPLTTINNIPNKFDQTKEYLDAILRPPIS
ncbi:hypothetical protein L1D51_06565 [Pseudoalteromonas shioyasakiensis]|uniref:hypothetical protein n=1 Tax=Pseudoalteromonas shioyasakiensis TaxID=1190813 RepID=UPI001EFEE1ED|nr:hypothetical protein [Pseudoalteromonas shioyasakiensis]